MRADQPDGVRVWGQPLPVFGVRLVVPRLYRRTTVPVVLSATSVLIARPIT